MTNGSGFLVARIQPGRAMTFNMDEAGATAPTTMTGLVTKDNGVYLLTVQETGVVYELTGENLDSLVGKVATITGTPDPNAQPKKRAAGVIVVSSATAIRGAGAAGMALTTKLIIGGIIVGASTGAAVGIYETQSGGKPPASF